MYEMNKKIAGVFAVLMVALSVIGFAYAHWEDIIYINGTVEMGELIFGFTEQFPPEDGKMDYFTDVFNYQIIFPEPKEVGTVTCELTEPETSNGKFGYEVKTVYKRMLINIQNAYPSYVARCGYTLDNAGTIPLDVYSYCVIINPGDGLTYGWEDTDGDGNNDAIVARNADNEAVINIWFEPFFFGQIDPCNYVEQSIYIHIKQPAEECHTYSFEIMIHAHEWDP
jgi:hypothetical protein